MEVHGTVHGTSTVHLPSYVKNHGILSGRDLQFLLRETKVSPSLVCAEAAKPALNLRGIGSAETTCCSKKQDCSDETDIEKTNEVFTLYSLKRRLLVCS